MQGISLHVWNLWNRPYSFLLRAVMTTIATPVWVDVHQRRKSCLTIAALTLMAMGYTIVPYAGDACTYVFALVG